jgi:hypothetical protein
MRPSIPFQTARPSERGSGMASNRPGPGPSLIATAPCGMPSTHPLRKPGVLNRWFGSPIGLLVPLAHQGEETGEFVTGIHCSDPCFADLIRLWKVRYRSLEELRPRRKLMQTKLLSPSVNNSQKIACSSPPAPATRHNRGPTVQNAPITRGR